MEEAQKHKQRLNILKKHMGDHYFFTGKHHNAISSAMEEYARLDIVLKERKTVAIFPSDEEIFSKVSELSKSSPSTAQLMFYSWLKAQVIQKIN